MFNTTFNNISVISFDGCNKKKNNIDIVVT